MYGKQSEPRVRVKEALLSLGNVVPLKARRVNGNISHLSHSCVMYP